MRRLLLAFALVSSIAAAQSQARYEPDWRFYEKDGQPRSGMLAWIAPYNVPEVYEQWWHEIADCEGFSLPPEHSLIRFYAVNAPLFLPVSMLGYASQGIHLLALTDPIKREIYLGLSYVLREELVKHEMLHVILWEHGYRLGERHPPEFFEKCGIHPTGNP
jgi:hypothetical protein